MTDWDQGKHAGHYQVGFSETNYQISLQYLLPKDPRNTR